MTEFKFNSEVVALDVRRRLIDKGREVSLLAFDPARGKYVFDLYPED